MDDPCTLHAMDQARARCGLEAPWAAWERARQDIIAATLGLSREAMLLRVQADLSERWLVRVATRPLIVVYLPEKALIVTVLPDVAVMRQPPVRVQAARGRRRRERRGMPEWADESSAP